jgi:hypothetical protein
VDAVDRATAVVAPSVVTPTTSTATMHPSRRVIRRW